MSKSSPSSNSIVNTKQGVVLEQTGLLDKKHLSKLHALSITTVEELLSMTQEAPQFMKSFLEGTDMSNLLNQASSIASINISDSELNMMKESPYTFGAIPPTVQLGHEVAQLFIDEEQVPPSGAPLEADLRNGFGPIRNQGNRGSCVAHAVTAMREFLLNKEGINEDLSEQFLYWLCKMNDGIPTVDGTFLRVAVPLMVQDGECKEITWPYNGNMISGNLSQGPPPPNAMDDASHYKIREGRSYSAKSVIEIQKRLSEGYPVAITVPVYPIGESSTFQLPIVLKTGNIVMPIPDTVHKTGHAVCLVGFAFDPLYAGGGFFIVRNSWDNNFGTSSPFGIGYGTIPFNYVAYYGWEAYSLQD